MDLLKPENVFRGKSVFVTGHTGFKGSWLSIWLKELGARVSGYSLVPPTSPSNFEASRVGELLDRHCIGDIRSAGDVGDAIDDANPDVIFHLAAQPLVRASYESPRETFDVNFMGTCNLLEAIRVRRKPCVVVVITSDKCYEPIESPWPYREDDAMGGYDPYSASKGATELLAASYRRSYFSPARLDEHGVKLATVRAGNVIGGGDWARDRIVPDIVAHLTADQPVPLRNPRAVRPWQHVLAPLHGYLQLAAKMMSSGDPDLSSGWNFGPDDAGTCCVSELVERFCAAWGGGTWKFVGDWNQPHEVNMLRLAISKAEQIGWRPVWSLDQTVGSTVRWYRRFNGSNGSSMLDACLDDIREYKLDMTRANHELRRGRFVAVAA